MKRELIITVIIVISIFILSFVFQNYTNKSVSEINEKLEIMKEDILQEKENQILNDTINKIYINWEEKYKLLSFYLEHNELEKINTQMKLIKGHIEADASNEAIPEIENCLYILKHLKDKQKLDLKNIF